MFIIVFTVRSYSIMVCYGDKKDVLFAEKMLQ